MRMSAKQYARRGKITGWAVLVGAVATFSIQSCSARQDRAAELAAATEAAKNVDYTGWYVDICERRGACAELLMTAQGVGNGRDALAILSRYTFTDGIANDAAVNAAVGRFGMQVISGTDYGRESSAKELLKLLAVDSPGYQL